MIAHDEALRRIIARAQEDTGFRDQLKAEPRAALNALLGIEIPSVMTVSVLEDTPTHLHIVLPADDRLNDGALEDEALEMVAGGAWNPFEERTMDSPLPPPDAGDPRWSTFGGGS
ncbi:NHLP leader peptide family RiPP precursor (plasmid) [Tistrella mobilis]|jgi:hypothetical protein|uniref:NHLP leader peptide family RiPP precursor n=1 Tax=Tistrella mobilis TaxID=171437 RepID=UPI0035587954